MADIVTLVSGDPAPSLTLARTWAGDGDRVTIVLVDASVAILRPGHPDAALVADALGAGASVLAHDAALRRRGLAEIVEGVKVVVLDEIADLIGDGEGKVMWL